jgi:ornithine decarboxylase
MALPQFSQFDIQPHRDSEMLDAARQLLATGRFEGPMLLLDKRRIEQEAKRFQAALPRVAPHYAVKCNPEPEVLATLKNAGCEFEIASKDELDRLLALDVNPANIFYSNPIKSAAFIRYAARHGVRWYVVDSIEEVDKIHSIHPGASLYLRIAVSNEGSLWPLESKFGCQTQESWDIIRHCAEIGADLGGVSFHVGSQCLNPQNWVLGIESAMAYFHIMREHGLRPRLLNLGGGFPARISEDDPTVEDFAPTINAALEKVSQQIRIIAEPGRALVASSGCMVCEVAGTATRSGQRWLYLDTGYYSGLAEFTDKFKFSLYSDRKGTIGDWTVAGPTCDSIDVGARHVHLPAEMVAGDKVYIPNTGAYTNATTSSFNGFDVPEIIFLEN